MSDSAGRPRKALTWRPVVAAAVAAAALLAGGPAMAAAPKSVRTAVDFSIQDPQLTAECGVPVDFFNVGTFDSKLFFDSSGAIVKEIDNYPNDKVGWRSPSTGRTVQFTNAAQLITEYPNGASLGAPATVTATGTFEKIPGFSAGAGRTVFSAYVLTFTTDGVPIIAFDGIILSSSGHANDPSGYDAAICRALTS